MLRQRVSVVSNFLVWIFLFALAPGLSLGLTNERMIVKFAPDSLTAEPAVVDDSFTLFTSTGTAIVENLASVIRMEPMFRRGSPGYSFQGPWVIWLAIDPLLLEQTKTALNNDPLVESLILAADDSDNPVIGETSVAMFPPHETSTQNQYFCGDASGQTYLHYRIQGEPIDSEDYCQLENSSSTHDGDMDCIQAWGISRGDTNVVVASIDLGFDWTHPALGGPGPQTSGTLSDSLEAYNEGVVFRNWNEYPGDHNGDDKPGVAGVDDDGDGLIDEDSMGREPGNTQESDVITGTVSSADRDTIYDLNGQFGNLIGKFLTGDVINYNQVSKKIISNTATMIVTKPLDIDIYPNGWPDIANEGDTYKIGNLFDDDADGQADDLGYLNDLADDDDENSFPDDMRGWDFVDTDAPFTSTIHFEKGDYWEEDNDPRGFANHGTETASQIASSWEYGKMVGIAPGVKILPLRTGYARKSVDPSKPYLEAADLVAVGRALRYATMMGVPVIVTAFGSDFGLESFYDEAIAAGAVHVNGAGNSGQSYNFNPFAGLSQPNILVAGLFAGDSYWWNIEGSSNYGDWVDVAARAVSIVSASPGTLTTGAQGYTHVTGTSLSGPIVGGVAALVKSVYPNYTRDEIISKIKSSVDNIYGPPEEPNMNLSFAEGQLLGTGRVNAYKAITFFGPVGTATGDTTWSGTVYVSGDITIPEGARLTINPGTTVRIAINDILTPYDFDSIPPNLYDPIEFFVNGELICNGTVGDPVVFELFKDEGDTISTWGPIVMNGGAIGAVVSLNHTHLLDFCGGIIKDESASPNKVHLSLSNSRIEAGVVSAYRSSPYSGVEIYGLSAGDYVEIAGCDFVGNSDPHGIGIGLSSASGETGYQVLFGTLNTITSFDIGVNLFGAMPLSASNINISQCGTGVFVSGGVSSPTVLSGILLIGSIGNGIYHSGGKVNYDAIQVSNSGLNGLLVDGGGLPTTGTNGVNISNSGLHGAYFDSVSNNCVISNFTISGSTHSGIMLYDCSPQITGNNQVSGPGGVGVFFVKSSSAVDGVTISGTFSGIRSFDQSAPVVRNCSISNCTYGVFVNFDSYGDFGSSSDPGLLDFSNATKYAINWNSQNSLLFLGNCFDGSTNASSTKFGTKSTPPGITNGVILYSPGNCQ
ncbi:MAG: S8 family serine peptidase [Candidatus Krumholzibacteriia bacterium]